MKFISSFLLSPSLSLISYDLSSQEHLFQKYLYHLPQHPALPHIVAIFSNSTLRHL